MKQSKELLFKKQFVTKLNNDTNMISGLNSIYLTRDKEETLNNSALEQDLLFFEKGVRIWHEYIRFKTKPSTFVKYTSEINNHILPQLGKIEINGFTRAHILNFIEYLIQEKKLSVASTNYCLIVLGIIFKFLKQEYLVDFPKIHLLKTEKKEMQVLSIQDEKKLLTYLHKEKPDYYIGIIIALVTGMRIGEVCALQWEDITIDSIHINKTMQRLSGPQAKGICIGSPKTYSSIRKIPINSQLSLFLNNIIDRREYVVCQKNGKYVEPRLLQMHFNKVLARCGIAPYNFHSLRHTFATRCVESGMDIKTLSEILGHSDVKTTLNKYVHSSLNHKKKQMELVFFDLDVP